MEFERDYPEPEEAVGQLIHHASNSDEADLKDTLAEASNESQSYCVMLQDVNVYLDHVCESDEGILLPQMRQDLRECQAHIQYTIEWLSGFNGKVNVAYEKRFE